ncbi:helix-turn-helix transcriptional regulator [Gilvibacter sp.]|uniref:helix-turn-helix transcriptional regulator n=1 Tax=Gilvibacter sp. TaxID=2729997 RepID=UPI003B523684
MTNKHAQIRYNILDNCFSNFNRLYTKEDLLEAVNDRLAYVGTEGIKMRQLQYDISYMQSDDGFAVEFEEKLKVGRKRAYRYADRNFSISNHPLNVDDKEQLEATLAILTRYKNREQFNWLEEMIPRIEQAFNIELEGEKSVISYQSNEDLVGKEHIGPLFNMIIKKKVVNITYKPFKKEPQQHLIHPYHLKQYNNRWFLFGVNDYYGTMSNFPLDRIEQIVETEKDAVPDTTDWEDYFSDIIGVTKPKEGEITEIALLFSDDRIDYVTSKPIHQTQRPDRSDDSGQTMLIKVIPNRELIQLILSFGKDVEVLRPKEVRDQVAEIISTTNNYY